MLMPVIFPLHDAEPDNGIVHPAQRLIVPLVRHRFGERLNIDEIERGEFDVEMRDVRVTLRVCHERSPRGPTALRLVVGLPCGTQLAIPTSFAAGIYDPRNGVKSQVCTTAILSRACPPWVMIRAPTLKAEPTSKR